MPTAEAREARRGPRAVLPQRQLREAIDAGDLELHYQPIVDLRTARITALEALLRLRSPSGTLLMPDDFLPAVAHTPVMHDITEWVLREACARAAQFESWSVAVNVAAIDVVRPSLIHTVSSVLEQTGLPAGRLTIELTEHAAVQGMGAAVEVLEQLRRVGVELSLDDFGTGYSSLLYLRDLPVTQVKIDRTFISGIGRSEDDAAIVGSVIELAHRVGLTVVAEGVERLDQLQFLRRAQCDLVQGFLLATPSPPADVPETLERSVLARVAEPTPRRRRRAAMTMLPAEVRTQIAELAAHGASLHTIAAALNKDAVSTPAGTRWTAASVARAISGAR